MDHLYTLNESTPKIRCNKTDGVDSQLVFGIHSSLSLRNSFQDEPDPRHNDEVEVMQLQITSDFRIQTKCAGTCHHSDHDYIPVSCNHIELTDTKLHSALGLLQIETVWRVKGFLRLGSSPNATILNWAFGRYDLYQTEKPLLNNILQLTLVGESGSLQQAIQPFIKYISEM